MRRPGWIGIALLASLNCFGDVVLIGSNIPHESVLDGDFERIRAGWRNPAPSPHWTTEIHGTGYGHVGFALGKMMNTGITLATVESRVLDHTEIQSLKAGDVLAWRFSSNAEYPCDGRVSLALIFGGLERVVAGQVKVPNGPEKPKVYAGLYTVTAEDAKLGMPRAKFTLESTHGIKVYVDWFDLKILTGNRVGELAASAVDKSIELTWNSEVGLDRRASRGQLGDPSLPYTIYRSSEERKGYEKVAEDMKENRWVDSSVISGKSYFYAVKQGTSVSTAVQARTVDSVPPAAPHSLKAAGGDWMVKLIWETVDNDVEYYKVYRGDADGKNMACIAPHVTGESFEDMLPVKSVDNVYGVKAVDYSGNEGPLSETAAARTKAVAGTSFSDLILPMPIHKELRSDIWGAETVLPRDPDNGMEDAEWSYWGGKVIRDPSDGKYHINVVRWPEDVRKGHWAWPDSTTAHAVAEKPTGPFSVVDDIAYDYKNGLGHNANIIPLIDGRYAMYSLIEWKPMIFTADTMNGPWTLEGEIEVDFDNPLVDQSRTYRYRNNLTGVQREDGSFLMVSKAGAVMHSTNGILGPYTVLTETVDANMTIPEHYRKSNYEDPTMWYDGVQYHMIINAFLDYRAIYLRSPDGINWKYEQGLAYAPACTVYEDGTRTCWYKVERPNVLQDEFGRATHLSLAAIDVPKRDDYGNDNHSSKHLIIPLVVHKRLTILNREPVTGDTAEVEVLIHSEEGFDAARDLDLESLRFGGSEAVNYGSGAKLKTTRPHNEGLILVFGEGSGITEKNFVGKLIGQTKDGGLAVGYSKLAGD